MRPPVVGRWGGRALGLLLLVLTVGATRAAPQPAPQTQLAAVPLRGLRAEVATLIVGGGDGGSLAMTVLALPMESGWHADVGRASVPLLFELEGATLLEGVDESVENLTVEFYVYALTGTGTVQGYLSSKVEVALDEEGEALYEGGVKFLAGLELPPGSYFLRFLAREPASSRYALRTLPAVVADPEAAEPRMSVPLVAEPGGGWMLAQQGEGSSAPLSVVDFPVLERGGERLLPTALALLPVGETIVVSIDVVGLPRDPDLTASLSSHTDDTRRSLDLRPVSRTKPGNGPAERLLLELGVPDDVAVGTYRLELSAAGAGEPFEVGLETVTVPQLDHDLVWGQLRTYLAADVLERRGTEVTLPRGRRRDRREIDPVVQAAYQEVLSRLVSTRQTSAAVTELVRRESEIFLEDPEQGLAKLRSTEVAIARLLGERQREGLLPLVVLHLEAYRLHRSDRNFALATHARLTAGDMAELYVSGGEDSQAPALAATALTCLAGDLTASRLWKQSDFLLSRAIELDPSNARALLMLASNEERFGEYASAANLAEKAVEVDPRADEARLRLAVNLVRLGHLNRAERALRRLLEVRAEEWLQVLAYEELTRLLIRRSRLDEAARTMRSGVSRHPTQQGLYVVLAYVLERLGQPEEGALVLERMPENADAGELSPRFRYSQPRPAQLEPLRVQLVRNAEVRLPILADALSESGG